jgi:hypothetical protein
MSTSSEASATQHGRASSNPARKPTCLCGAPGEYDDLVDTYYCPTSGVWLEDTCGDPRCSFCATRPECRAAPGW